MIVLVEKDGKSTEFVQTGVTSSYFFLVYENLFSGDRMDPKQGQHILVSISLKHSSEK